MCRRVALKGFFRDTRLIWEMGLGGAIAALLALAGFNLAWIGRNIGENTLIILILGACYILYLIRHFFRLCYGTVEILIGLIAIFGAMGRARQVGDDPSARTLLLVQLAAGMYIIIRGFDNFAQSAPFSGGFLAFREGAALIRARWARKKD
jgi:hypothetical protein